MRQALALVKETSSCNARPKLGFVPKLSALTHITSFTCVEGNGVTMLCRCWWWFRGKGFPNAYCLAKRLMYPGHAMCYRLLLWLAHPECLLGDTFFRQSCTSHSRIQYYPVCPEQYQLFWQQLVFAWKFVGAIRNLRQGAQHGVSEQYFIRITRALNPKFERGLYN